MKEKKVKVSTDTLTEPSSDGLKENKKERKLEQVSFFLPDLGQATELPDLGQATALPDPGQATALPVIPHFRGACPNC